MTAGAKERNALDEPIGYAEPPERRTFAALTLALGGPALFLFLLGVRYHLADLACGRIWARVALEGVAGAGLLAIAWMGWSAWRRLHDAPDAPESEREDSVWGEARRRSERLLLELGWLLGALFTLLQLAQWIPQWIVGPCHV